MRLYPDVYGRRFAWMLADLVMVAWIYLCVRAGLWVNNLVLQLDALAQGVINAGKTFDSWILSFEQGIPNSVPYLSDFLHRTADALKVHSGDSLISAGQAGSRGIHLLALILAIILYLFMEYTSTGRRLYATGFSPDAAKLAGVRVDRLRFCSLLTSSLLAGFAGVFWQWREAVTAFRFSWRVPTLARGRLMA